MITITYFQEDDIAESDWNTARKAGGIELKHTWPRYYYLVWEPYTEGAKVKEPVWIVRIDGYEPILFESRKEAKEFARKFKLIDRRTSNKSLDN